MTDASASAVASREMVEGLAVYRRPPSGSRRSATGARVVLVHGTMDRAAGLLMASRRLVDLDVVLYDRRGYGRSTGVGVARTVGDAVEDLMAVIDGIPAVVVGHSLGGVIALAAAERHRELVISVGAFEAPMPWLNWWPGAGASDSPVPDSDAGVAEAAEGFMRRLLGDERWENLPAGTRRKRREEGPALAADIALVRGPTPPYRPEELRPQVLAGCGSESSERHRRAARMLASSVPHGELVVIDGAGHDAPRTHPEAFAAYVRQAVGTAPVPSP